MLINVYIYVLCLCSEGFRWRPDVPRGPTEQNEEADLSAEAEGAGCGIVVSIKGRGDRSHAPACK
jgi:hypothetical protein